MSSPAPLPLPGLVEPPQGQKDSLAHPASLTVALDDLEVGVDGEKNDRMGFWTPPTDENRAIRKAEAENLSNDGAIWVTSPWKPSYLGYIGSGKAQCSSMFAATP